MLLSLYYNTNNNYNYIKEFSFVRNYGMINVSIIEEDYDEDCCPDRFHSYLSQSMIDKYNIKVVC